MFQRWYSANFRKKLSRPYVHLVFGARQTGKSTLIESLLPKNRPVVRIDLTLAQERSRFLVDPDELVRLCKSLPKRRAPTYVFVDEAQSVPAIFDAVQHLYDSDRERWRFILCGSSARKLRRSGANLLPGRSFLHSLHPLTMTERPPTHTVPSGVSPLTLTWTRGTKLDNLFPTVDLETRLTYGDLPGVAIAPQSDRADILRAYALVHLEEEMRREALVKDWAAFVRFLRMAALESGRILNYAAISNETGISQPTVKGYYQLLEDMFIGVRIHAWSKSPRKNVLSTPKFLLFDLGVRHAAAGLEVSRATVRGNPGPLFEQWVGLELWRRLRYLGQGELYYLRTRDGAEIDFIVEHKSKIIPFEVKWTERPTLSDARHLITFLKEHPKQAKHGYVICRCPRPLALANNITALPWFCL